MKDLNNIVFNLISFVDDTCPDLEKQLESLYAELASYVEAPENEATTTMFLN